MEEIKLKRKMSLEGQLILIWVIGFFAIVIIAILFSRLAVNPMFERWDEERQEIIDKYKK